MTAKKRKANTPGALLEKPKAKRSPRTKRERRVNIEKVRERMKTHKPAQSLYDEDHTGLY